MSLSSKKKRAGNVLVKVPVPDFIDRMTPMEAYLQGYNDGGMK